MMRRVAFGTGLVLGVGLAMGFHLQAWSWFALLCVVTLVLLIWFVIWVRRKHPLRRLLYQLGLIVGSVAIGTAVSVLGIVLSSLLERVPPAEFIPVPEISSPVRRYVALGDSYSAGEGVRPYTHETGKPGNERRKGCHRSEKSYALLLQFATPLEQPRQFRACSGARIGHVLDFPQPKAGSYTPQVDNEVRGDRVDLITLTLGGNDLRFADILEFCFLNGNCLDDTFDPGEHGPDETQTPQAAPLRKWIRTALPVVMKRLHTLLHELRYGTHRHARIVVIGYPKLLPTGKASSRRISCSVVLQRYDSDERDALAELSEDVNEMIYETAVANEVEYVNPNQFWYGRSACGSLGHLTNALSPRGLSVDPGSFHPNRVGQRVLARTIACYLNQYHTPFQPFPPERPLRTKPLPAPGTWLNPLKC